MNNQFNDKVLNIFIIVLILISVFYIIFYLVNSTNIFKNQNNNVKIYNYLKGNKASENLDLCKFGCQRSVCKTKNVENKHFCKYDFQCNYCKDRKTNNFYADLTNYEEVLPDYDIQDELSLNQSEDLNDEIKKNNDYIDDLNDKIRKYNGVK